eukprot:TRINITY_DN12727_c0_g1_i1.p1 TRINITY_DN12727_c0_g1~~TRINITY_DN12727_c0_g1_i1.p1  ORF type:complete len:156 (+),score=26.64 TRINITY_DN12727_c0_g1_i1:23-469(+)
MQRGLGLLLLFVLLVVLVSVVNSQQNCKFTCPSGKTKVPNPDHVPTSNGCGAGGLLVSAGKYDFTDCCNEHDICYDTCDRDRNECDKLFGKCLAKYCKQSLTPEGGKGEVSKEEKKACLNSAQLFQQGSSLFGCGTYKASQANACLCV